MRNLKPTPTVKSQPLSKPVPITLHGCMCARLSCEFDTLEHAASVDAARGIDRPTWLPESYFVHLCHLFFEKVGESNKPNAVSSSSAMPTSAQPFSAPMIQLLDKVIEHLCEHYDAYEDRYRAFESARERSSPLLADSVAPPPSLCRCFDLFLDLVSVTRARILPHLRVRSRFAFLKLERSYDLFEEAWMKLVSRINREFQVLERAEPKIRQLEAALREWWGIQPIESSFEYDTTSHGNHLSAHAPSVVPMTTLSEHLHRSNVPILAYGLREPLQAVLRSSAEGNGATAGKPLCFGASTYTHVAPLALYHRAMRLTERIFLHSNSEVCLEIMTWMNAIIINAMKDEQQICDKVGKWNTCTHTHTRYT